jgi:hypothetical protein
VVPPDRQCRLADAWKATVLELDGDHDAPVARHHAFAETIVAGVDDVLTRAPREV